MTEQEQDELLDAATHAAAHEFAQRGITLPSVDLYRINDFLTALLAEKL